MACPATMAAYDATTFEVVPAKHWWPPVRPILVVPGAFCLDRTEITVEDYEACVDASACSARATSYPPGYPPDPVNPCSPSGSAWARHPANCVTAAQAETFCAWRKARLPSFEELVLAFQGGAANRAHPWGNAPFDLTRGNGCGGECAANNAAVADRYGGAAQLRGRDAHPTTAPVGSFPAGANREGVADLVGNVREWTSSLKTPLRVVEEGWQVSFGSSWRSPLLDMHDDPHPWSADRQAYAGAELGFRCASTR